ncbi:MAG: T9SS type A sorting domain-containing protein [Chitinophagaceae bacterium]|nr:T9SS type A sorting domain-containing protein [Chitinophagaceae bacterium]
MRLFFDKIRDAWYAFQVQLLIMVEHIPDKRIALLSAILSTGLFCSAQSIYPSTINVTGQFGTMKDFQFELSIGESTSVTTMSSRAVIVTNGLLQTSVVNQPPVNTSTSLFGEITLYPNPARDFVQVNFIGKSAGMSQYELYDTQGKMIISKRFYYFGIPVTEKLDVRKLLPGTYVLSVQQFSSLTNLEIKKGSFKIVKVN